MDWLIKFTVNLIFYASEKSSYFNFSRKEWEAVLSPMTAHIKLN